MYELVNTSAERGLVALTNGFTTVAMTRGMSEGLRVKLEAFCAYQHRVCVAGEKFFQENPVNWFHAVGADGVHVMGRVGPCACDYTGRTNRLARLCVLEDGEWPQGKSAAELLRAKGNWFGEAWAGEPRYLEEDKGKLLELQEVEGTKELATWRDAFGERGAEWAQRVAWQVEKNMLTDRRAFFFKTSPAWDVSGEKLLGLFAEVIHLLPDELKGRVTFATYPVAMPSEVECALRGSWDADPFAAAVASSQAWIDCETGCIMNEELLPNARVDWSTLLDEIQKENNDLKETLANVQAAHAVLDKEYERVKRAQKTLEEEHAALKKEHEKLKCTLLMATGKLRPHAESANESAAAKIAPSAPTLSNIQIERSPRTRLQSWTQADTGLKLIMAAGLLIVSLIILGVVMIKYSEELSLRSSVKDAQVQEQGVRR